jgi:hypothetical protein
MSLSLMGIGKETVTALLTGCHQEPPSSMSWGERARFARQAYLAAKKPLFCKPRHLALGLGFELRPVTRSSPATGVRAPECIYYEWTADQLEMNLEIYHCIASKLFRHHAGERTFVGVCLLAAELAFPEYMARNTLLAEAKRVQPHVPGWWLIARMQGFHRSGVTRRLTG